MTDSTEADIDILDKLARSLKPFWHHTRNDVIGDAMAAITNLRAERDAAVLAERERCAQVCMGLRHPDKNSESNDWIDGTEACASAILATDRKNAT